MEFVFCIDFSLDILHSRMKLLLIRRGIHAKMQAVPFHAFLRHTMVPSPVQSPREASLQFAMMK